MSYILVTRRDHHVARHFTYIIILFNPPITLWNRHYINLHIRKPRLRVCFTSKLMLWASLVAQWLRIHLPMQGTRVRALVWEDPTAERLGP